MIFVLEVEDSPRRLHPWPYIAELQRRGPTAPLFIRRITPVYQCVVRCYLCDVCRHQCSRRHERATECRHSACHVLHYPRSNYLSRQHHQVQVRQAFVQLVKSHHHHHEQLMMKMKMRIIIARRRGIRVGGTGWKLHFFPTDSGNFWQRRFSRCCSKFQFFRKISPQVEFFSFDFYTNILRQKDFWQPKAYGGQLLLLLLFRLPCYDTG